MVGVYLFISCQKKEEEEEEEQEEVEKKKKKKGSFLKKTLVIKQIGKHQLKEVHPLSRKISLRCDANPMYVPVCMNTHVHAHIGCPEEAKVF